MRIFVDCHVFDGTFQGTTTYLKGLYSQLFRHEDIEFYLAASHVEKLSEIFGKHKNVHYLEYRSHNKFFRLLWDIPALIKKHQIDYAHFQYVVPPVKYCKYIVTLHDVLFLDFPQYFPASYRIKNRFLFQLSARLADVLLTVSDYSANRIAEHFDPGPVEVIPNAVDPVFYESFDRLQAKASVVKKYGINEYWLFVSRREPRKNHLALLKAFVGSGNHLKYHLLFVGDIALPDAEYQTYYNSLPAEIKAKVNSLEKVAFSDLLTLVRAASLSVYPSFAEGFGIPPLESLACGVPSVCSNTTAMSDFTFFDSWLFDPNDPDDLKRAIEDALNNPHVQEKREAMSQKYDWEKTAEKFLDVIKRNL